MPLFAYRGRTARGDLVQGTLEAADADGVATSLIAMGITPVEIRLQHQRRTEQPEWLQRLFEPKVTAADLLLFTRHMYTLMRAGVPILRAFTGLAESSRNPAMVRALNQMRQQVETGRDLSSAMRDTGLFSPFYLSMIRVGEMTGRLDEVFLRLFYHLEFEEHTRQQIKSALRYPTFVLLAMAVAIVIINLFVIPAFAQVFAGFGAELPYMTRLLIAFSNFMVESWPLLLAGTAGALFAFRAWTRTARGRYQWDRFKLRIPVAGEIIHKATLARFARALALASKSGVPIVSALSVVARVVDNDYLATRIEQMRDGVERGESLLRTAVASAIFTPVVLQMIAVGEETGAVDELMEEIAEMYDREVEYAIKNLSSAIEPILVVGMGILVLILALGVFLPMWDLGKAAFGRK